MNNHGWSGALYLREMKAEFTHVLRTPSFSIPTLAFPLMFYLFFGIVFQFGGSEWDQSKFMMVTYTTFGIIGPALFGFGTVMATERDQGWLRLKRVSPMPAAAYFVAKAAMSMLFAAIIIALLFIMAYIGGGVRLTPLQWLLLAALMVVGSLPFVTLGLWIGSIASATSAIAIVNLIYLPMGLLSGLWFPLMLFPPFLQTAAHILPAYHLSQLGLKIVEMDAGGSVLYHACVLGAQTLVFVFLARVGFKRMQTR